MSLTLDGYQNLAAKTAVYVGRGTFLGLMYTTGKLNGEAGELAEHTFKALRDDGICSLNVRPNYNDPFTFTFGELNEDRRLKLKKELGDILWYVSQTAHELGYTLSEIAAENIYKLQGRAANNTLRGDGDDR